MDKSNPGKKEKISPAIDVNDSDSSSSSDSNRLNITSDDQMLSSLGVISFDNNTYEDRIYQERIREIDQLTSNETIDNNDLDFDVDDLINESTIGNIDEEFDSENDEDLDLTEDYVPSKESEDNDSEFDDDYDDEMEEIPSKRMKLTEKKKSSKRASNEQVSEEQNLSQPGPSRNISKKVPEKIMDDGDIDLFLSRYKKYKYSNPMDKETVVIFEDYEIPKKLYEMLKVHQIEGIKWLLKLYKNDQGGILADEMGLGKTLIIIAFLVVLYNKDNSIFGPILILCPATLMSQWVEEFHKWWPPFRVALLHSTGSYMRKNKDNKFGIIEEIVNDQQILITSYKSMVSYVKKLTRFSWHCVILDEGHKIRTEDTQVNNYVQLFKAKTRYILSGTPIMNKLSEIWCLINFVRPGLLGTLNDFKEDFEEPILRSCLDRSNIEEKKLGIIRSRELHGILAAVLLRRTKMDYSEEFNLPNRTEKVLMCQLTDVQKNLYMDYISELDISNKTSKGFLLKGLGDLRKICNHPSLFAPKKFPEENTDEYFQLSGKMIVVESLLKKWKSEGSKVLLYSQSVQILTLFEKWFNLLNYTFFRMDGSTSMKQRSNMIAKFNSDESIFIFLLSTKVGGEGISLTSANRVIIYDPDWNPSTDAQARERCWRMGQTRDVQIMRLFTLGTIEEKIFNRQTRKRITSTRVLENPCFSRYFKIDNFKELFTFSDFSETTLYMAKKRNMTQLINYLENSNENQPAADNSKKYKIPKLPSASQEPAVEIAREPDPLDQIDWSKIRVESNDDPSEPGPSTSTASSQKLSGLEVKQALAKNEKKGLFRFCVAPGKDKEAFVKVESTELLEENEIENVVCEKDYDSDLFDDKKKTNQKLTELYKNSIRAVIDYDKFDNTTIPDMNLNHLNNQIIAEKITRRLAIKIHNFRYLGNRKPEELQPEEKEARKLLYKLCLMFNNNSSQLTSTFISETFKTTSEYNVGLFIREILDIIATPRRDPVNDTTIWTIKDEYDIEA